VASLAAVYLKDAGTAMQAAETSGNTGDMIHLSYLAETKSRTAMAVASGKRAEAETRSLNQELAAALERKKELDRQREIEKRKAEEEAEKARRTATEEAERAARMKEEAERARLAAAAEAERAAKAKEDAERARLAAAMEAERAAKAKDEAEKARLAAAAEAERAARAQAEAERARAEADQLMKELSDLKAKQTERGIVLTIGDVLFAFGKADLSPKTDRSVRTLADFLKKYPNRNVLIEGHTDSIGSDDYNLGLSRLRAESVKTKLAADGIEPARITTVGYGKKYPAFSNDTEADRAQNRRVEVIILNEGVSAESQMRE